HVNHRRHYRHNAAMVVLERVALETVEDWLTAGDRIVGVASTVRAIVQPVLDDGALEPRFDGLQPDEPRLLRPPVPQPLTLRPVHPLLAIERRRRRAGDDEYALTHTQHLAGN